LAFEDELGYDPSQPIDQNYALSATGMVSKTVSLWSRKIVQYILIVGVISAACVAVSVAILAVMFGLVGTIGSDPFSYVISFCSHSTNMAGRVEMLVLVSHIPSADS
jgi:hypothetical protein